MSKRLKIIALAVLATIMVIAGAAIPVMADDEPTPTPPAQAASLDDFLSRVAQILGVSRENLVDAFKQAREELRGVTPAPDTAAARLEALLTKAAGILGKSRDELVNALQEAATEIRGIRLENALAGAVENNVITPEEAEQIRAWYAQRPAALDKLLNLRALKGWCQKRLIKGRIQERIKNRLNITFKPAIGGLKRGGGCGGSLAPAGSVTGSPAVY